MTALNLLDHPQYTKTQSTNSISSFFGEILERLSQKIHAIRVHYFGFFPSDEKAYKNKLANKEKSPLLKKYIVHVAKNLYKEGDSPQDLADRLQNHFPSIKNKVTYNNTAAFQPEIDRLKQQLIKPIALFEMVQGVHTVLKNKRAQTIAGQLKDVPPDDLLSETEKIVKKELDDYLMKEPHKDVLKKQIKQAVIAQVIIRPFL